MILSCQQISLAFGTEVILDKISFHIKEHEKTAIVGINGAGKSTLLKIIMGELTPDSGEVIISRGKTIGYLAQHQDMNSLIPALTVLCCAALLPFFLSSEDHNPYGR